MSTRDTATTILILTALKKEVDARLTAAKATAQTAGGFDRPGVRDIGLVGDDGQLGAVQVAKGATSAAITDEAAFLAWAQETIPGDVETVTVTRVRPDVQARILAAVKGQHGAWLNEATGELVVPDGVEQRTAPPTLRVTADPDISATVRAAVEAGVLDLRSVLELGPAPTTVGGAA